MPEPKPCEIVYSESGNVTIGAPIAKMEPREKTTPSK
jgi:hypothetical protein